VVEIAFGAFILLGLLTRLSAVPLLMDISVAIATTKVPMLLDKASGRPHMSHAPTSPCCLDYIRVNRWSWPWSVDARLFRYLSQRK